MLFKRAVWLLLAATLGIGAHFGTAHAGILVHHYDFQTGVTDLVGSANGTLFGNATVSGGVLNLDGNGDYVQFGTHLVPTTGSFSVALVARRDAAQGGLYSEIISQGISGGPGFYIGSDPSGNVRVGDQWLATGVAFGAIGDLVHYAVVVDSIANTTAFYMDGALVGSRNLAIGGGVSGTDTRLGRQFSPHDEFFRGILDDVRIYTGTLTADEVARLADPAHVDEPGTLAILSVGLLAGYASLRRRRVVAFRVNATAG